MRDSIKLKGFRRSLFWFLWPEVRYVTHKFYITVWKPYGSDLYLYSNWAVVLEDILVN